MAPIDFLPKVRAPLLLDNVRNMPCALRIAGLVGLPCAPQETVVAAHLPTIGKGVGTKVSDLMAVAACATCHDLLDRRASGGHRLVEEYPAALALRMLHAVAETQARWIEADLIQIKGGRII